jgi:acyl carrier protein
MSANTMLDATSADSMKAWLIGWVAEELGFDRREIDPGQSFLSFGMNSVQAMMLVGDLEARLSLRLPPTLAWDYPNIDAMTAHLIERMADGPRPGRVTSASRPGADPEPSRAEVERLLAGLDLLSDQDVDRLLERYLGEPS